MKPFFSYYGSKYRLCQQGFYPAPRGGIVIEPFAGSASYSVYHEPEIAILIDKDPIIVGIWDYLIHASEDDIPNLPTCGGLDGGDYSDFEDVVSQLDEAPRNLIGFWMGKAGTKPREFYTSWFAKYCETKSCMVWESVCYG